MASTPPRAPPDRDTRCDRVIDLRDQDPGKPVIVRTGESVRIVVPRMVKPSFSS